MSVRPKYEIDKKLAKIYANVQTNNFDMISKIDPEQIMKNMNLMGLNNRILINAGRSKDCQKIA